MVPPKDGFALVSINILIYFQSIVHKLQYYQNRKKNPFHILSNSNIFYMFGLHIVIIQKFKF
jgi:hypothetical protein